MFFVFFFTIFAVISFSSITNEVLLKMFDGVKSVFPDEKKVSGQYD